MKKDEEKEPEGSGQPPESIPEELTGASGEGVSEESEAGDTEAAAADAIAPDSELAEALREKDQFRALAQRAQADFVNFRSRVEAGNTEIRRKSVRSVLIKILEVMDSVEAALEPDATTGIDQKFIDGVEAISRSFESFLSGESVEKFDSGGEKFDPRLHEALMRTETDGYPSETVIRVMRAGYRVGDDVLRPALVEVAAALPASASDDEESAETKQE